MIYTIAISGCLDMRLALGGEARGRLHGDQGQLVFETLEAAQMAADVLNERLKKSRGLLMFSEVRSWIVAGVESDWKWTETVRSEFAGARGLLRSAPLVSLEPF